MSHRELDGNRTTACKIRKLGLPTKVTKQITFLFINYLVTILIHRPVGVHVPFWSPLPAFRGNYWVLSSGSIFVLKWNKSRAFPLTMNCVRKFNCFNYARCNLGKVETDSSPRLHQFVVGGLSEVFQGIALFFRSICFGVFLASFPSFPSILRVLPFHFEGKCSFHTPVGWCSADSLLAQLPWWFPCCSLNGTYPTILLLYFKDNKHLASKTEYGECSPRFSLCVIYALCM